MTIKSTYKISVKGYSLIELIIAIVVFAIAVTTLIISFSPAVSGSANPAIQIRAAELGQALLEEIVAKRFDENSGIGSRTRCGETGQPACSAVFGPDMAETRANFDDVDDYQDADGIPNVPVDALGVLRPGYENYRVLINVTYAGADIAVAANDAKRIDIQITAPTGDVYNFSTYKTNF